MDDGPDRICPFTTWRLGALYIDWCLHTPRKWTKGLLASGDRMSSKHFHRIWALAVEADGPPQPHPPHQRYRHRFGVVSSFALFQTETYLHNSPSLSFQGEKFTHLHRDLGIEKDIAITMRLRARRWILVPSIPVLEPSLHRRQGPTGWKNHDVLKWR